MNVKCLWFWVGFLGSLPLHGLPTNTLHSPLFRLEKSLTNSNQIEILAFESPRILYIDSSDKELVSAANLALQTRSWVKLSFTPADFQVFQIELTDPPPSSQKNFSPFRWEGREFEPSRLENLKEAKSLFDSVDSYSDADLTDNCFARAHYWSRAIELGFGIKSMKVFVLFTPLYRNENNFQWWYHVAPYIPVKESSLEESQVLDPSYQPGPRSLRDWVFVFASKAEKCRVAKDLSEYYDQLILGGCVVIMANMFHYTPSDLRTDLKLDSWKCNHLTDVQKLLRSPRPYSTWQDYEDFLPEYCY